jgi:threonine synthase
MAGYVAKRMGLPIRRLVLATNENDVLDEFFRTGRYRPRAAADTHATSSPSMDISKASNFERFIWDAVGRDGEKVAWLWKQVEEKGGFDLSTDAAWEWIEDEAGFASGRSTHEDRIQTIRLASERYGEVIDPHTADGLKIGLRLREARIPMICLETALPVKFDATIVEALGRHAPRPTAFEGLEERPQRFDSLPRDPQALQAYIAARC